TAARGLETKATADLARVEELAAKQIVSKQQLDAAKAAAAAASANRLAVERQATAAGGPLAGAEAGVRLAHARLAAGAAPVSAATGSKFALLPPDNATGNFTKVVQRVPVRIAVTQDLGKDRPLRPGMSVTVHVETR